MLYEIGERCAQRVHSSKCPPSAAVRHRAIASSTLTCFQRIHWRFRSTKAAQAVRMRSAISSAGGVTGAPPPQREPHVYQNPLAITAPLAHAYPPPPGGYVLTDKPEVNKARQPIVQNLTPLGPPAFVIDQPT